MDITTLLREPLPRFMLQIVVIVALSRVLGVAARRIAQPMVVAEIAAGILLGPSLFGLVAPQAYALVFAPEFLRVLWLVSQLGLVLFMFIVGLELDFSRFRGLARRSAVISLTSIVVPFALGAGLASSLDDQPAPGGSRWPLMLFMGAAMSVTAFPVLARILTERGLIRTEIGILSLACASIDDVSAWCLLAFIVAATRASGLHAALATTVLALGYITLMLAVVRPLLARWLKSVNEGGRLSQNLLAGMLVALFVSSWITELIGVHALFGAFVFGATLPNGGRIARELTERLQDLTVVVLLPLFFAYSGVRTQLGLLESWAAWGFCAVIVIVACIGKGGASTLAARAMGFSWREAGAVGILMNTRGLVELIVLNVGLDLGIIDRRLFTMMVLMALVTTFMTTPLVQLLRLPRPALVSVAPLPAISTDREPLSSEMPLGAEPALATKAD